jgi:hypothetical protein
MHLIFIALIILGAAAFIYQRGRIRGRSGLGIRSFRLKKATLSKARKLPCAGRVAVRSDHRQAIGSATMGVERERAVVVCSTILAMIYTRLT